VEKGILNFGRQAGLCLAAAFGLTLAVRFGAPWLAALGQWTVAIFLLRAARLVPGWRGYLVIALTLSLAVFVTQRDVIPMPPLALAGVTMITGFVSALAYPGDRLLASHLPRWIAPLVFPARLTAVAYVGAQFTPFGTWGNPAYAAGLGGFWGLVAVTGLWGVDFMMGWLASAVNAMWEKGPREGVRVAGPWLIVCGLVLVCSWAVPRPGGHAPLRAAAITPLAKTPGVLHCHGDRACARDAGGKREDELFVRSEMAVRQGAKLILWSEGAMQVFQADEPAFRARAKKFAAAHDVYLFAGVVTVPPGYPHARLENKIVAVTPAGVAWEYHKSKVVPGEPLRAGPGIVPVLQTPWGRVAAVICFDADFPALVRQAGSANADILLIAANDWAAIATRHAEMARFRAAENGVVLIRAAAKGRSSFADGNGRVLAQSGDALLVATVTPGWWPTFYPLIGDAFAWLCLSVVVIAGAWRLSRRQKTL
jgi:apolipoprotein N-acyltransferase